MNNKKQFMNNLRIQHPLTTVLLLTIASLYFYFFMEWLFFLTKPSMLNVLSVQDQLAVLLLAPLPALLVLVFALFSVMLPIYLLVNRSNGSYYQDYLLIAVPALILACCILLLAENFTYTLFQFGMYRFPGYGRLIYTILFIYLWYRCCKILYPFLFESTGNKSLNKALTIVIPILLLMSLVMATTEFKDFTAPHVNTDPGPITHSQFPNILVLSSDGINARNMSVYGYKRQTTPFFDSVKNELLIFENHLTNSQTTTGSIAAFHSGKLPTNTKLIYRPDMFKGDDAYQHLPGILMRKGYYNGDFSVRHYIDPEDINLKEGFHYANNRDISGKRLALPTTVQRAYPTASRFHDELFERISTRLSHLFWRSTMSNPFLIVTEPDNHWAWDLNDRGRVDDLKQFITKAATPFYAHAHLLGTHGFKFHPANPLFSKGQKQTKPWMTDFYDDAILDYDQYAAELVAFLKSKNLYENTLIIFTSDHGKAWRINETIPLLIRFPDKKYTGIKRDNSQHTDITPTILDFLNLEVPNWMDGRSLLSAKRNSIEAIFAVQKSQSLPNEKGWHRVVAPQPPFYTLGSINATYCHMLYRLKLPENILKKEPVKGHTRPCQENLLPSPSQAHSALIEHLNQAGYDTRSLKPQKPVSN